MFVDEVEIHVAAGHGGKGALSFRREKFVPRGGPDGGDGGPGGNVFLVAHANLNTLLNFRFQKIFEAGNGAQGEGSNRTGKTGGDITLKVPIGTQVFERSAEDPTELHAARGSHRRQPEDRDREGRPRRPGQRALRDLHQPRAAPHAAGTPGRRERPPAAAQAAGGRGPGRLSERRQVDDHLAHLGGQAEDRRVSVHHARPQPRRRRALGRPLVRRRRRAGPDRRGARGPWPWASLPQPSRADARAGAGHRRVVHRGTRSDRGLQRHHARARAVSRPRRHG